MIALTLIVLVVAAGYIGYVIGVDTESSRERPCRVCQVRQQTVAAEMQLQRLTHAAITQMLDTARRTQRGELP